MNEKYVLISNGFMYELGSDKDKAFEEADKQASYNQCDMLIYKVSANETDLVEITGNYEPVYCREWIERGGRVNKDCIDYGKFGFYTEWRKI
jgi:hypothetical protein